MSGELIHMLNGHSKCVTSVAVGFDGFKNILVSGSEDTTMILWNLETG